MLLLAGCGAVPTPRPEFARGVAIGMFGRSPHIPYARQIDEVTALGASHVAFVVTGFVDDVRGNRVFPWEGFTPTPEELARAIATARRHGLEVMVFPILRLARRTSAEWRGVLKPDDEEAFFDSYESFVMTYGRAAAAAGASAFIVGSELNSLEKRDARWRTLIARMRGVFPGKLLYSANWDRYERVPFWDALDAVGISAYYELAPWGTERPDIDSMVAAWQPVRAKLAAFSRRVGRPIYFTELGYPSQVGAASRPWDETRRAAYDEEEQRRCFIAFARAFATDETLAGAWVWIWYEPGGLDDRSYTPRGKSAELSLREFYRPRSWLPPPR